MGRLQNPSGFVCLRLAISALTPGLSRSSLNELTTPGLAHGNKPSVKSLVQRKPGAVRGIRLINYDSLMRYGGWVEPDRCGHWLRIYRIWGKS